MTTAFTGNDMAARLPLSLKDAVTEARPDCLLIRRESLADMAAFLKQEPGLNFDYLVHITAVDYVITAVDYVKYFELVYHLVSLQHNHSLVLKTRCDDRQNPTVPSLAGLWEGANLQEREIFDLMGIGFDGHPNMKRIFLWDGFPGHPQRKDFSYDA
jgi:NADH-quinone oxidoreductase subunit C